MITPCVSDHLFAPSVLPLKDADWENANISLVGPIIAMYYTDWCGNCKRISPIWSEFADLVSSAPEAWGQLRVACVKATDERNNPGTKHVKGFPTILYLLHGEVVGKYNGAGELHPLKSFATSMIELGLDLESEAVLTSKRALEQASKTEGRGDGAKSNREKQTRVQQEFEDLVPEVTDSTYFKRVQGRHTLLFVYAEWCMKSKAAMPHITSLAAFPDSIPRGTQVVRLKGTHYKAHPAGRHVLDFPSILFLDRDGIVAGKYNSTNHSVEALKEWAESFANSSPEDLQSAKEALEIQAENNFKRAQDAESAKKAEERQLDVDFQAAVPELTDANANETLSSGSDTVVMFYAEKCAECMAMKRAWMQLTQDPGTPSVKVLRNLSTKHKINPGMKFVKHFPTLLYFRGAVPVSQHEGQHTLSSFRQWIAQVAMSTGSHAVSLSEKLEKADRQAQDEDRRKQQDQETRIRKAKEEERRKAKSQERKKQRTRGA
eukprot:CAMPEP_0114225822 /NCGR_PEP_ID=MMETSP0058-20121206/888_1 /TAXON_ID=36894 /ORGANISM="Pyramimonas parkeae, CCMP726" /LENGTH=489 /DNA_ID=CAMNT_0001336475 /DNA_START=59 /DNA_END=1528 /DNA_ORIENTATION=+